MRIIQSSKGSPDQFMNALLDKVDELEGGVTSAYDIGKEGSARNSGQQVARRPVDWDRYLSWLADMGADEHTGPAYSDYKLGVSSSCNIGYRKVIKSSRKLSEPADITGEQNIGGYVIRIGDNAWIGQTYPGSRIHQTTGDIETAEVFPTMDDAQEVAEFYANYDGGDEDGYHIAHGIGEMGYTIDEASVTASTIISAGWMAKAGDMGYSLQEMIQMYCQETGADNPAFGNERAKKAFRKWAEAFINEPVEGAATHTNKQGIISVLNREGLTLAKYRGDELIENGYTIDDNGDTLVIDWDTRGSQEDAEAGMKAAGDALKRAGFKLTWPGYGPINVSTVGEAIASNEEVTDYPKTDEDLIALAGVYELDWFYDQGGTLVVSDPEGGWTPELSTFFAECEANPAFVREDYDGSWGVGFSVEGCTAPVMGAANEFDDMEYLDQLGANAVNFIEQQGYTATYTTESEYLLIQVYADVACEDEICSFMQPLEDITVIWDDLMDDADTLANAVMDDIPDEYRLDSIESSTNPKYWDYYVGRISDAKSDDELMSIDNEIRTKSANDADLRDIAQELSNSIAYRLNKQV